MTDVYDQATYQEELMRERALEAARKVKPTIWPTGYCHNCDEFLRSGDHLFCDVDCRDDWQKRQPK